MKYLRYGSGRLLLGCFVFSACFCALYSSETGAKQTQDGIHDALKVQKARTVTVTSRGGKVFYTKKWDLSGLPRYVPEGQVAGTITLWGSNYLVDGNLGKYWAKGFAQYHPNVKVVYKLKTAASALPGLLTGRADIGVDHKITWKNLLAYQRVFDKNPLEVSVATGSFDVPGWSNALVIVVNKENPLSQLTVNQLDGIFGAQRTGGWVGTTWHPEFARGPAQNIRTWGQLGLRGKWANKPIHVYGLNLQYQQALDMSHWVLKGSDKWNERLRMYANYAFTNGTLAIGAKLLVSDIGRDPYGIGYGSYSYLTPKTKVVGVASRNTKTFVTPSLKTVRDRSYPLYDQLYMYVNKPLDPKVREFLRYILSRDGQEAVERDGKYLPLTANVVRKELRKLQKQGSGLTDDTR